MSFCGHRNRAAFLIEKGQKRVLVGPGGGPDVAKRQRAQFRRGRGWLMEKRARMFEQEESWQTGTRDDDRKNAPFAVKRTTRRRSHHCENASRAAPLAETTTRELHRHRELRCETQHDAAFAASRAGDVASRLGCRRHEAACLFPASNVRAVSNQRALRHHRQHGAHWQIQVRAPSQRIARRRPRPQHRAVAVRRASPRAPLALVMRTACTSSSAMSPPARNRMSSSGANTA